MSTETDLFNDEPTTSTAEPTSMDKEEASPKESETKVEDIKGEESSDTGDKDNSEETPSEDESSEETKAEKLIPESRFKAALKDVNDKLTKANQKLAEMTAKPAPDRAADPDGYELHVRIETSKEIMRSTHDDYDSTIAHYQAMAKENPYLNQAVAAHKTPAKHAYDIAKKDMEIQELTKLKGSEDWKEFQAFKATKDAMKTDTTQDNEKLKPAKPASKVPPNLNRAADLVRTKPSGSQDTDLFKGAL